MLHGKKLGFEFTTLLVLTICVAFASYLFLSVTVVPGGPGPTFQPSNSSLYGSGYNGFTELTSNNNTNSSFFQRAVNIVTQTVTSATGVIGTVALILGTTFFPNPYLVFAAFFLYLVGFLDLPEIVFGFSNQMPPEFQVFINLIYVVLAGLAVVSWFKGSPSP